MKGIILAAGKGTRLEPLTLEKPKGLLQIGNETILDRLVSQFQECGIKDILIVVGHQKEIIKQHFGDSVRYSNYTDFENTNNLHTLWSIKEELNDDVLITFADLILHKMIIKNLIKLNNDITMAIDTSQVLDSTMRVSINSDRIKNITTTSVIEADGNFIGIAKINKNGCKILIEEMASLINSHFQDYYTIAIDKIARKGIRVNYFDTKDLLWREVDTKTEYDEVISIYDKFET